MRAALLKTDLVCYAFVESALQYIVEVRATLGQKGVVAEL
jgi:hypothetical protein